MMPKLRPIPTTASPDARVQVLIDQTRAIIRRYKLNLKGGPRIPGVSRETFYFWPRLKRGPNLLTICRVLDAAGYTLVITKKETAHVD